MGETSSLRHKNDAGRPKLITPDQESEILARVDEDPQVS